MRKGDWIQTYTGRQFWPLDPRPEDVDILDIAHALANLCRFTGHTNDFYSVAQHSTFVSFLCLKECAVEGLLHDAAEAYLIDLPAPLKRCQELQAYREAEILVQEAIWVRFGVKNRNPVLIKQADRKAFATECRDLMSPLHPDFRVDAEPYPGKICPQLPKEAELGFLKRWLEIYPG